MAQRRTSTTWPDAGRYSEVIQSPARSFSDPDLRSGSVKRNQLGLPIPRSGNFAVVFEMEVGNKRYAVKCFTQRVANQQQRYSDITAHLAKHPVSTMVEFRYLDQGIRIGPEWFPILKMEWVPGDLLSLYVEQHLHEPHTLRGLAAQWRQAIGELQANDIAHGDLQNGNVKVGPGGIRFVDYDGLYVPALKGKPSAEIGARHFQHPARRQSDHSSTIDNFSAQVIYLSLVAVAADRSLWTDFYQQENLIFTMDDFTSPGRTPIWGRLQRSPDSEVRRLAGHLERYCKGPVARVDSLEFALTGSTASTPLGGSTGQPATTTSQTTGTPWYIGFNPPPPTAAPATPPPPTPSDSVWDRLASRLGISGSGVTGRPAAVKRQIVQAWQGFWKWPAAKKPVTILAVISIVGSIMMWGPGGGDNTLLPGMVTSTSTATSDQQQARSAPTSGPPESTHTPTSIVTQTPVSNTDPPPTTAPDPTATLDPTNTPDPATNPPPTEMPIMQPEDLVAFLPGASWASIPTYMEPGGWQIRDLDEVVQYYSDPVTTAETYRSLGWVGNAICSFVTPVGETRAFSQIDGIYVSIHSFDQPSGARQGMDWIFEDLLIPGRMDEIEVPALGDYSRALYGPQDYGFETTLMVQVGTLVLRVSASSTGIDPTSVVMEVMEEVITQVHNT